ncbi:MAG: hypothetical protein ABSF44_07290 [Candidatus Bathyarchaeia archaeon]
MIKYSKLLFGFFAILGFILLAIFFMVFYWEQTWSSELLTVQKLLGDMHLDWSNLNSFFFFTLIAGTALLVVGMLGIIMQSRKKHRVVFAILTVVLVPLFIFGTLFSSSLTFNSQQTEKLTITNFRLDSIHPLTCSVDAKSFYYYEIDFDTAFIKAYNQTIVAQINSNWVESTEIDGAGGHYMTMNFLYRLPPGDERTLIFNFNTTLPSGNYTFWLSTYRQGSFISFNFAVP